MSSSKNTVMWEKTYDQSFLYCVLFPTGITGIHPLPVRRILMNTHILSSHNISLLSSRGKGEIFSRKASHIFKSIQHEKILNFWCFFPKGINQVYFPFPSLRFKIASWSLKSPNNKYLDSRKNIRKKAEEVRLYKICV